MDLKQQYHSDIAPLKGLSFRTDVKSGNGNFRDIRETGPLLCLPDRDFHTILADKRDETIS